MNPWHLCNIRLGRVIRISIVYGHLFVTFVTQTMCFLSLLDIWTGLDDHRDYFSIIDMLL